MIRDFNYTSQCLPDSEDFSNNAFIASNSLCALLSNVYDKVEDASLLNTSELYLGLSRCIYTTAKIHEFEGGNITETTPFKRSDKNSTATTISTGLADVLKVNNQQNMQLNINAFKNDDIRTSPTAVQLSNSVYALSDFGEVLNIEFLPIKLPRFNDYHKSDIVISKNQFSYFLNELKNTLNHIYVLNYRIIFKNFSTYMTYFVDSDTIFRYWKGSKSDNPNQRYLLDSNITITSPLFKHNIIRESLNNSYLMDENKYGHIENENIVDSLFDALGNAKLVYSSENLQSDIPNFNISDNEGSNGVLKGYKTIQCTNNQHLDTYVQYIQYFLQKQTTINYKFVIDSILSLFRQWFNNINVMTVNVYMCHSNCHYNGNSIPIQIDINYDINIYYQNLLSASGFEFVDEKPLSSGSSENKMIYYKVQYSTPIGDPKLKIRTYGSYNFFTNLIEYSMNDNNPTRLSSVLYHIHLYRHDYGINGKLSTLSQDIAFTGTDQPHAVWIENELFDGLSGKNISHVEYQLQSTIVDNKYTAIFNSNGGSFDGQTNYLLNHNKNNTYVFLSSSALSDLEQISPLSDLSNIIVPTTNESKAFIGWYTKNTNGENIANLTAIPYNSSNTCTFYAYWQKMSYISCNANGGNFADGTSYVKYFPIGKTVVFSIDELPKPTRASYQFIGWYDRSSGGIEQTGTITFMEDETTEKTLYAHWNQTFTVTFNCNDGSINGQNIFKLVVAQDDSVQIYRDGKISCNDAIYVLDFDNGHQQFNGWFTTSRFSSSTQVPKPNENDPATIKITSNKNFYAQFVDIPDSGDTQTS